MYHHLARLLTLLWVCGGDNFTPPPPPWFSLNNSGMETLAFSNILLETSVPNLVSLTCPSFQISGKIQMVVFPISAFLVNPL